MPNLRDMQPATIQYARNVQNQAKGLQTLANDLIKEAVTDCKHPEEEVIEWHVSDYSYKEYRQCLLCGLREKWRGFYKFLLSAGETFYNQEPKAAADTFTMNVTQEMFDYNNIYGNEQI